PGGEARVAGALAGLLPLVLRAQPLAGLGTEALRVEPAHRHARLAALLVGELELVHAERLHRDAGEEALVAGAERLLILLRGTLLEAAATHRDHAGGTVQRGPQARGGSGRRRNGRVLRGLGLAQAQP